MEKQSMAVLLKAGQSTVTSAALGGRLDKIREIICAKVSKFLFAQPEKTFSTFTPAHIAWRQEVHHPFGVVFGETEPALFGYFYSMAKCDQESYLENEFIKQVEKSCERLMDGKDNGIGLSAYALSSENFIQTPFIKRLVRDEFIPDGFFYSLEHNKALLEEYEHGDIMKNHRNYALCILNIYM